VDGIGRDGQVVADLKGTGAPALPDEAPEIKRIAGTALSMFEAHGGRIMPDDTCAADASLQDEIVPAQELLVLSSSSGGDGDGDGDVNRRRRNRAKGEGSVAASAVSLTVSTTSGSSSLRRRKTANSERLLAELARMDAEFEAEAEAARTDSVGGSAATTQSMHPSEGKTAASVAPTEVVDTMADEP